MTYNFDPDRWLDNELAALAHEFQSGHIDEIAYEKQREALMQRYDEMSDRLDGTYRIGD